MNRSLDPDDINEELRAVEAKLRTLKPREARIDWTAMPSCETVESPKVDVATTDASPTPATRGHRRKLTLAATWLSGVAVGCLLMANFQSQQQSPLPRNTTTIAPAGENQNIVGNSDSSPAKNGNLFSDDHVVAIIDEASIRLCSASHLSKSPAMEDRRQPVALTPTNSPFVPHSTTPATHGSRRELMDKLLRGAAF